MKTKLLTKLILTQLYKLFNLHPTSNESKNLLNGIKKIYILAINTNAVFVLKIKLYLYL